MSHEGIWTEYRPTYWDGWSAVKRMCDLVRCGDCCCYHQTHEDGTGICARHGHGTAPDAFCAWGERKEDNE